MSLVVHALILILLALIFPVSRQIQQRVALVVDAESAEQQVIPEDLTISIESIDMQSASLATTGEPLTALAVPDIGNPFAPPAAPPAVSGPAGVPAESLLIRSTLPVGGGIEGRTPARRARLAGERGGTAASENAVELGLAWLARHQHPDGSWSLRFNAAPCHSQCADPGTMETTTGATSLALLPFLGAGYTHVDGPYKEVIAQGLYYLTSRMVETPHGGELHENITMYAQGLATLTLCEAFAMTGDANLQPYAQKAIDFICYAQHPRGGWRYFAGQPGDTTVTGWQGMALKSAQLRQLHVPYHVRYRIQLFLDGVQEAQGAFYGYQAPDKAPGPTAVALLLRMYGGWQREDDRLSRGITYLAHLGPSPHDVYFNFYATQVLHHFEGPMWHAWNVRMRDRLVAAQGTSGHERGSWFFPDKHGSVGGRLYTTAMCLMILEVYYRYLPLYGQDAVSGAF